MAELRQAEYYKTVLEERRTRLEQEIAGQLAALEGCQVSGEVRAMRRLQQTIVAKRREQYELDCLRQALQRRFFPGEAAPTRPAHFFDIETTPAGSWWNVSIPEIDAVTKVRRREDVELAAREHIAVIINTCIADIGVRVVSEP